MKNPVYSIRKLGPHDEIPFDLLLLADETKQAIEKYIYESDVYVVKDTDDSRPIAVFALYRISDAEMEIKNIAVANHLQGRGIGSVLMEEIKKIAAGHNYTSIIVGTPDCSYRQISFYERHGFSKYGVRKNFFIENYPDPIIEDGIMLRDMVMLKTNLL